MMEDSKQKADVDQGKGEPVSQADEPLMSRVIRGGMWVAGLKVATRTLGLVRTVIVARLLVPEDFGLLGIALLTMGALQTFTQTGFGAALVQKKDEIADYLDTAWTFAVLRGVALSALAWLAAPLVANFFESPQAAPVLRMLALVLLIEGLQSARLVFFQRELLFNREFIYSITAVVVELGVAVTYVLINATVWALVYGVLAGAVTRLIMSYVIMPHRPRFDFNLSQASELFGFGKWVTGASILVFANLHLDDALVGKLLGAGALGFYQMAYRVSNLPTTEITHVMSRVTFPAYAKVQDNLSKLRSGFLRTLRATTMLSIPLAAFIALAAPELTRVVLGEKWMPMVPAMQVLAIWGAIRSMSATTGPLFQGVGRPDLITKLTLAKLVVLCALLYPLTTKWDIWGASVAVVVAALAVDPFAAFFAIKIVRCSVVAYIRAISSGLLAAGAASGVLVLAKYLMPAMTGQWRALAILAAGVFAYSLFTLLSIRLLAHEDRLAAGSTSQTVGREAK